MEDHFMFSSLLVSFLILFVSQKPITQAATQSYIVYLGPQTHTQNDANSASLLQVQTAITTSHYSLLGSFLGSEMKAKDAIFYSYTRNINGFAAILDDAQALEISKLPQVVSVFPNKGRKLHTTRSWEFLRVEQNGVVSSDSIWTKARYGEDTIIGNLDTGVWPESKSFSDEGIGPIPSRWRGSCQSDIHDGVKCNRKLIGAKYFNKGYFAYLKTNNMTLPPEAKSSIFSVRDQEGHGSHTLSTAGGNFVAGANVNGNGNGTAKGGSPKARVAAYKVCWPPVDGNECFDADILAGFDAAISDGVDVLSVSLGGTSMEYFNDGVSIGSFHAIKNGISVVASAGNSGPFPTSVSNVSPWLFTIAASTLDRQFSSYVALGNKIHIKGQSLARGSLPVQKFYPLIKAIDARAANVSAMDAIWCKRGSLNPRIVRGKIVVCLRGEIARIEKGLHAKHAGAVGMILANSKDDGADVSADLHYLPTCHINYNDGNTVFAYLNSTKTPVAYMTGVRTEIGLKPAPMMAIFSSRGPNLVDFSMLKPDITAPGVSVIAAFTEAVAPSQVPGDKRRSAYFTQSGTSMSTPHIAGVVGLLKTLHPDWSPAAIKSAIMTTATTRDSEMKPMMDYDFVKATPFMYGAGHVNPNGAADPGLVYDTDIRDYLNYLCGRGYNETVMKLFSTTPYTCPKSFHTVDLNYPTITAHSVGPVPVTITRRLKNVGSPGTYTALVRAPVGFEVSVNPKTLTFINVGEEKSFQVVVKAKFAKAKPTDDYVFGRLKWFDGKHSVKSPLVVSHI